MRTRRTSLSVAASATFVSVLLQQMLFPHITAQVFDPMVICQGKPDNATVTNPVSCELFMLCKNNLPADTGQCPDNMLFNAIEEYCDFPGNVDCGSVPRPPGFEETTVPTTTVAPIISTVVPETPNESCPAIDNPMFPTFLPVADDCSSYILCYYGKPLPMKCPAGLEWNRVDLMCDKPENAKCQAIFNDPFGCPAEGSAFLPHPEKCEMFIFCLDGISRVQVCQMFKHFDPIEGQCVLGPC